MAAFGEMFLERSTSAVDPNTERPRRDAQNRRGILRRQTVPGNQSQRLAIAVRQLRERPMDVGALGVNIPRVASTLGRLC
jgi:hypothetical protein